MDNDCKHCGKSIFNPRFKKKYYAKTANLLTGNTEATEEEQAKAAEGIKHEVFSHWHPNITINLVVDYTPWAPGNLMHYWFGLRLKTSSPSVDYRSDLPGVKPVPILV